MINIIFILSFSINFYILFLENVHIFQLNHYKLDVQNTWISKNIKSLIINSLLFIFITFLILFIKFGVLFGALVYLVMLLWVIPKKAKKTTCLYWKS